MNRWRQSAQQVGLAVLVVGAVGNGLLHADLNGAVPSTGGLTRLERDLLPRANACIPAALRGRRRAR